ncbi:FeoA family protein [Mahella sp.]|uniref:FeoA family protein n=1 Tax=Mahella sp. TaxID=2798721 RepID=UPI0025BD5A25|nr:FeoA family protein [Mahella sp.]MBZ4666307.1 FeoA family protein [Mahella sp.]MDK2902886.1 ferrous iron transport protein [Clostridiales bacterium]
MRSVADMQTGQKAAIMALNMNDQDTVRKLMALGIVVGSDVELVQSFPSYVIKVGYTQIAIDKDIASSIFVN